MVEAALYNIYGGLGGEQRFVRKWPGLQGRPYRAFWLVGLKRDFTMWVVLSLYASD